MFRFLFQFALTYEILIAYLVSAECTFDSDTEDEYNSKLNDLILFTAKNPIIISDANYTYTIGICTPVEDGSSTGVTQADKNSEHRLGDVSKAHVQSGSNWIFLQYEGGDPYGSHCNKEKRQSHIMIICDEDDNLIGSKSILEENNARTEDCYYLFEITSTLACSVPKKSALSIGSILIILFICIVFVYLVGGFLYQRFIIGAKGSEQFPNIAFWRDFGNLIADGCDLAFRTQPKNESRSYKGIGDDQLGLDEDEEQDDHLLPM